ncbi:MAG: Pr6Pr family membrane protein [Christensenellaceae bacterium]
MYCLDKSKFNALIIRLIGFLCGLVGVIMSVASKGSSSGMLAGGESLLYYSVQSSILITIFFGALTIYGVTDLKKKGDKGLIPSFANALHLAVMIDGLLNFLVFWGIVSWTSVKDVTYFFSATNILLHIFLPVLCFVDWLLFTPHGGLKYRHSLWSLAYPVAYYVFVVIRSLVGDSLGEPVIFKGRWVELYYPYKFLEPVIVGNVFLTVLIAITLGLIVFGLSLAAVKTDKKLFVKLEKDEYLKA